MEAHFLKVKAFEMVVPYKRKVKEFPVKYPSGIAVTSWASK